MLEQAKNMAKNPALEETVAPFLIFVARRERGEALKVYAGLSREAQEYVQARYPADLADAMCRC
jgi:hypothetical protein